MVVRMRRNRSQTAKRRSHHALSARVLQKCACGAPMRSHRACPACGKYRGHTGRDMLAKAERTVRRTKRRERELKASGQITPEKDTAK